MRKGSKLKLILFVIVTIIVACHLTGCGCLTGDAQYKISQLGSLIDRQKENLKELHGALDKARRTAKAIQDEVNSVAALQNKAIVEQLEEAEREAAALEEKIKDVEKEIAYAEKERQALTKKEQDYYGSERWQQNVKSGCNHPGSN